MRLPFFLLAVALFTSCTSTRPQPDQRQNASLVAPAVKVDSLPAPPLPAVLPRLTDALGLSTPAGRARRQARRDARAAAPGKVKVGKGGQYAPNATQAVNGGNKPAAPTTAAGPAATVSNAAENSQQQNAQGDNNDLSATQANPQQESPSLGAVAVAKLTGPVGIIGGILLLAVVGGIVWYLVPLLPNRRKNPSA